VGEIPTPECATARRRAREWSREADLETRPAAIFVEGRENSQAVYAGGARRATGAGRGRPRAREADFKEQGECSRAQTQSSISPVDARHHRPSAASTADGHEVDAQAGTTSVIALAFKIMNGPSVRLADRIPRYSVKDLGRRDRLQRDEGQGERIGRLLQMQRHTSARTLRRYLRQSPRSGLRVRHGHTLSDAQAPSCSS